ncbi:hypothetical protein SBRCBS47491_000151 [Sporothrix bragantina]|uniref:L-dopachrome isomerase n=1 Tax=Sporothrix bragantina TaxID=671064 RepID=A0ABP0AM43_9PEZI
MATTLQAPAQAQGNTYPQTQTHTSTPAQMKTRAQTQTQAQRPRPLPTIQNTGKVATTTGQSQPSNSYISSSSYGTTGSHNKVKTYAHNDSAHSNGSSVEVSEDVNDSGIDNIETDGGAAFSFSQRATQLARAPTPLLVKGDRHLLRDIDRPPPGDPSTQLRSRRRSLLQVGGDAGPQTAKERESSGSVARKRSQYFEDAFSARDADTSPAKERVRSEAPVLAEVRTNVIVGDEFTVVTELSAHLALRYRRPLSSIVVTLQHGACICFGGSFAPAYVMTVTALPAQLQPATNKRNAALIQQHMEESLGVPPSRGHLQFVAVPEANLAYGGKTAVGHADDLAKAGTSTTGAAGNANGMYRSPTGSVGSGSAGMAVETGSASERRKNRAARRLSVKSLSSFRAPSPPELTPPPSAVDEHSPTALAALPAIPERSNKDEKSITESDKNKPRKEAKRATPHANKSGQASQEKKSAPVGGATVVQMPPSPPTSPVAMERLPSRRTRGTKSFVATLFGRSATKPEGNLV